MTLIEVIRKEQLQARKEKRTANASTLTTLIGEAEMIGKNDGNRLTNDSEVVGVIKKFVKNIDETLNILAKDALKADKMDELMVEKALLMKFLPVQLTENQLRDAVNEIIISLNEKNPKMMGKVLMLLKDKYAGQYDGATASKITKEILTT